MKQSARPRPNSSRGPRAPRFREVTFGDTRAIGVANPNHQQDHISWSIDNCRDVIIDIQKVKRYSNNKREVVLRKPRIRNGGSQRNLDSLRLAEGCLVHQRYSSGLPYLSVAALVMQTKTVLLPEANKAVGIFGIGIFPLGLGIALGEADRNALDTWFR